MDVNEISLTDAQLKSYRETGYLMPVRVMSREQASELRAAVVEHLTERTESERYELTDPVKVYRDQDSGLLEYDESSASEKPSTLPFLFNLWKWDGRFREVGLGRGIAGLAHQLLGVEEVLLMEDNVVVKSPNSGFLPWHQDFSYWPVGEPAAVTIWVALEDISQDNGGMQLVPGSHQWRERLPVNFGDSRPFMGEFRPGVDPIPQNVRELGYPIVEYSLEAGECGLHHPLVWHASAANKSSAPRIALILRYLASGTVWLGATRMPYDDVGCAPGERVTAEHFPAIRRG